MEGRSSGPAAVPLHHLLADVPLEREVFVRDGGADPIHLPQHGLLVGREDLGRVLGRAERVDDRVRRRHRDLEAHAGRQLPRRPRVQEVLVRRPGLARIAQLAEVELLGPDAVREPQRHELDPAGPGRPHRSQAGVRAQQRDLPTDPLPAARRARRPRSASGTVPAADQRSRTAPAAYAPHQVRLRGHVSPPGKEARRRSWIRPYRLRTFSESRWSISSNRRCPSG